MPPFCFHYLPSFFGHNSSQNKISVLPEGVGGGGLLPINRVIGMCCWMGVTFSRHELTIMGLHFQLSY